jgi:hypothetical protein
LRVDLLQSGRTSAFRPGSSASARNSPPPPVVLPMPVCARRAACPQPAQLLQLPRQQPLLALAGIQAVVERLEHRSARTLIHSSSGYAIQTILFHRCWKIRSGGNSSP